MFDRFFLEQFFEWTWNYEVRKQKLLMSCNERPMGADKFKFSFFILKKIFIFWSRLLWIFWIGRCEWPKFWKSSIVTQIKKNNSKLNNQG